MGSKLTLRFKRYLHDRSKAMVQDLVYSNEDIPDFETLPALNETSGSGDIFDDDDDVVEEERAIERSVADQQATIVPSIVEHSSDTKHESEHKQEHAPSPTNETRQGVVESVKAAVDGEVIAIVKGLFTMEEDIRVYSGALAVTNTNCNGEVVGPFGKLGKCKV